MQNNGNKLISYYIRYLRYWKLYTFKENKLSSMKLVNDVSVLSYLKCKNDPIEIFIKMKTLVYKSM